MDSLEQLKAWGKVIAATSAISFVVGATAALVANRYTGHREAIAPSLTNKNPAIAAGGFKSALAIPFVIRARWETPATTLSGTGANWTLCPSSKDTGVT